MTSFHNVRLPEEIEQGAQGGPRFKTTILEMNSGQEQRNIEWSRARGRWDISYGVRDKADIDAVRDFFYARYARAYGFRFKDWMDFELARTSIGTGNGSTTNFDIYKYYSSGGYVYARRLTRIVENSESVWVDNVLKTRNVDYYVDYDNGKLYFLPGHVPGQTADIEIECEFDVPVRFDIDELNIHAIIETEEGAIEGLPAIPILELRE